MSEEAEGQEPTMEEILASIRRIISEDDEEGGEAAPAEAAAEPDAPAEPEGVSDDDVMELTDMVMEEAEPEVEAEPDPEPEPEPEPEIAEPVLESAPEIEGDIQFAEPEPEPEPEPVFEAEPEEEFAAVQEEAEEEILEEAVAESDNLISGTAETATAAAFSALASSLVVSTGESKSLEDLVSQLLRPMLKAWMDENLPSLVEDMVREEIERVARRGR